MARDDRLFFKLTLDFPAHAKILPLSDAAFRCLVEAIAYSRQQLTDGKLARRYALARWSPEVLRELCENDPEKPSLIEREDGWHIHDYADMNDTAVEVESRRERNRQAGKQGGLAKAKRVASKSLTDSLSECLPETETETETDSSLVTYVGATDVSTPTPAPEAPDKPTPRKRGTRIPSAHWMPDPRTVEQIQADFPGITNDQLRHEHNRFIDWATGSASRNAVKLDWDATWRGWMRRELPKCSTVRMAPAPSDARVARVQALKTARQEITA